MNKSFLLNKCRKLRKHFLSLKTEYKISYTVKYRIQDCYLKFDDKKYKRTDMKKYLIVAWMFVWLMPFEVIAEEKSYQRLLEQLDEMITRKNEYHTERERNIAQLKQRLANEQDESVKYDLCDELFSLYLHFQADSALHYVDEMQKYMKAAKQPGAEADMIINRADAMGVMGAYNEALQTVQQIDRSAVTSDVALKYYYAMRTYYGWIAGYTIIPSEKQKYVEKTACYRDSVLMLVPEGVGRSVSLAEKMILESRFDAAIPRRQRCVTLPCRCVNMLLFSGWHGCFMNRMTWNALTGTCAVRWKMPWRAMPVCVFLK